MSEPDAPPAKRVKSNFLNTFDVLVGTEPNQQRFTVYHDILIRRSDFLRAASSERWNKDLAKPVDLTDHEPAVFARYLHCVYFNEVQEKEADAEDARRICAPRDSSEPNFNNLADELYEALVKLYMLADKLGDRATANLTIDNMLFFAKETGHYPGSNATTLAYTFSPHPGVLRELFVDFYFYEGKLLPEVDFPTEFLRAFVERYLHFKHRYASAANKWPAVAIRNPLDGWTPCISRREGVCERYHQHDEGQPRCKDPSANPVNCMYYS